MPLCFFVSGCKGTNNFGNNKAYHPNWNIDVYNLEVIIRLAYTIDSDNSHKFRQFIMNRLMDRPMYANVRIILSMKNGK